MFLDLICWAPEAFFLIGLLGLLCYGSGSLVCPVAERICFLSLPVSGMVSQESMGLKSSTGPLAQVAYVGNMRGALTRSVRDGEHDSSLSKEKNISADTTR
jgi:hypothetical protein